MLAPLQTVAVSADKLRKVVPRSTEIEKVLPSRFLSKTLAGGTSSERAC